MTIQRYSPPSDTREELFDENSAVMQMILSKTASSDEDKWDSRKRTAKKILKHTLISGLAAGTSAMAMMAADRAFSKHFADSWSRMTPSQKKWFAGSVVAASAIAANAAAAKAHEAYKKSEEGESK